MKSALTKSLLLTFLLFSTRANASLEETLSNAIGTGGTFDKIQTMIVAGLVVFGAFYMVLAVLAFKQWGDNAQTYSAKRIAFRLLVGTFSISSLSLLDATSSSLFGDSALSSLSISSVASSSSFSDSVYYRGGIGLIALFGCFALVNALTELRDVGQDKPDASVGAAITYLCVSSVLLHIETVFGMVRDIFL